MLSAHSVAQIRAYYRLHGAPVGRPRRGDTRVSYAEMAARYGVHRLTVLRIVNNQTWRER